MQEQKIYGRRDGAVGHLVFNNPAKLNAVSLDMWDAFVGILRDGGTQFIPCNTQLFGGASMVVPVKPREL